MAIQWESVKAEIRQLLVEVARTGQVITYSDLTSRLQTAYLHYHSHILARLLVEIGWEEVEAGRPVLPALVVTKQTGLPGHGFFKLAAERGYDIAEPEVFWASAVKQVHDYWSNQ
jgi:hypothetical protein